MEKEKLAGDVAWVELQQVLQAGDCRGREGGVGRLLQQGEEEGGKEEGMNAGKDVGKRRIVTITIARNQTITITYYMG